MSSVRAQPVRCMVTTMLKSAALLTASLLLPSLASAGLAVSVASSEACPQTASGPRVLGPELPILANGGRLWQARRPAEACVQMVERQEATPPASALPGRPGPRAAGQ